MIKKNNWILLPIIILEILEQVENNCLILRNHGLLTVGESIPAAFRNMYNLQRACEIQVLCDLDHVQMIPQDVVDNFQSRSVLFSSAASRPNLSWEALLRSLDNSYKL